MLHGHSRGFSFWGGRLGIHTQVRLCVDAQEAHNRIVDLTRGFGNQSQSLSYFLKGPIQSSACPLLRETGPPLFLQSYRCSLIKIGHLPIHMSLIYFPIIDLADMEMKIYFPYYLGK